MVDRVRVLQIVPNLRPGGAERAVTHLARALDPGRYEVAVLSLYDRVGSDLEALLAGAGIPLWHLGKRVGLDPHMFARVANTVRRFRPCVAHTHLPVLGYCLPALLGCRTPAMVHTVHSLAEREAHRAARWAHRVAFRCGVAPVAVAQEVRRGVARLYGVADVPLIRNGIPVALYQSPALSREAWRAHEGFGASDLLAVCVASLTPVKNHGLLLAAFGRVVTAHPEARLLLVGEGDLRASLAARARAAGLASRVHFLGHRTDIPEVLAAADLFVMASSWEGHPLSVMEALAAGCPVVAPAVGGIPEIVDPGETGALVPPGDADALAAAVRALIADPDRRRRMGEAAAVRARERFDVGAMARAYEALYESLLARGSGVP